MDDLWQSQEQVGHGIAAGVPVCASCGRKLHGVAALIHEGTFAEGHKTNEVPIELTFAEVVHAEGK